MSRSSPLDEEHAEVNDEGLVFPASEEGHIVFEDKILVSNEEDQLQELEVRLHEECPSDVSATVLWRHVVKGRKCGSSHGGSHVFKCKYCQKVYHGTYTRVYAHLMGHRKGESKGIGYCPVVKADKNLQSLIKREVEQAESLPNVGRLKKSKLTANSSLTNSGLTNSALTNSGFTNSALITHEPSLGLAFKGQLETGFQTQESENADSKIIRCLCANGIPFNVLRSPYWEEMVSAISKAPGCKGPSYERAQTILLDIERDRVERSLDDFKEKWHQYGISVISNGWTDAKNQPLINILVSNQFGSMFLYALDFSIVEKSQKNISEYLLEAIEKVGTYNVVQLITDNATQCKAASEEVEKAYPHIFWTPCIVHTLNLILKDSIRALPWLEKTCATSKGIMKYFTYHSHGEEIFRSHPKLEFLKVATTCAPHYITLQCLLDVKEALKTVVESDQWEGWASSPNLDEKVKLSGDDVKAEVMSEKFWEAILLALFIIKPIYKMVKFTDQEGPLIGEVCERMANMLGEIKDNLKGQEDIYMIVEEKVFIWWNKSNIPLHCLACVLTPKYYDEEYLQSPAPGGRKRCRPDQDDEIFDGAQAAIFKMHPNVDQADTIRVQLISFFEKNGRFSSPTAKRDAKNPKINVLQWWKFHGGDTKELRDMAFKVLSQSISTSSVERPWSTYSFIHNAKRNRLNASRADKLMYIHSNLRLLSRFNSSYKYGPQRKWDINPELPLMDESTLQWEDMYFLSLDDEGSTSKEYSQSHNLLQELMRINEDAPSNSQSFGQGQATSFVRASGGKRGRPSGSGSLDSKRKTKKFL